jgi:hypothetical protein
VEWIGLAKDRNRWRALVNSVLNLQVPWNAGKLSSALTSSGLSSSAQLHRVSYLVSSFLSQRKFSLHRRRNVQAKVPASRGATRFRPVPYPIQFVH